MFNLKKTSILLMGIFITTLGQPIYATDTVEISEVDCPVIADTSIMESTDESGKGPAVLLSTKNDQGNSITRFICTKTDLSPAFDTGKPSSDIKSAKLYFYVSSIQVTPADVAAYSSDDDNWDELSLVWSNASSDIQSLAGGKYLSSSASMGTVPVWASVDVTNFVKTQYDGDKVATIKLYGQAGKGNIAIHMRENETNKPYIKVTFFTNQEKAEADRDALTISYNGVDPTIGLPSIGSIEGSTITWESDNQSIIASDGTITRPATTNTTVKLTATITKGIASVTKEFNITVFQKDIKIQNIQIAEDTYTEMLEASKDVSFGNSETLLIKNHNSSSTTRTTYMKSDLSSLPDVSSDSITAARLYIYVQAAGSTSEYLYAYGLSNDAWDGTLTYNTAASMGIGAGTYLNNVRVTGVGAWFSIDVLSFVKQEYTNDRIASFRLSEPEKTTYTLHSIEGTNKPYLSVTYVDKSDVLKVSEDKTNLLLNYGGLASTIALPATGPINGCTITWASSDESAINPATGAVTRPQSESLEVTLTATITSDAESDTKEFIVTLLPAYYTVDRYDITEDTFIDGASPSTVRGEETQLRLKGDTYTQNQRNAFLKVDLTNLKATSIKRANLHFYLESVEFPASKIYAYSTTVSSDEWDEATLKWEDKPAETTTLVSTISVYSPGWYAIDVTDIIAQNLDQANATIRLFAENGKGFHVISSTDSLTNKPYVEIASTAVYCSELSFDDTNLTNGASITATYKLVNTEKDDAQIFIAFAEYKEIDGAKVLVKVESKTDTVVAGATEVSDNITLTLSDQVDGTTSLNVLVWDSTSITPIKIDVAAEPGGGE